MKKTIKETSWRTLMLMTTVLILVIIFESTVRPYKPKTPLIGPAMGEYAGRLQPGAGRFPDTIHPVWGPGHARPQRA